MCDGNTTITAWPREKRGAKMPKSEKIVPAYNDEEFNILSKEDWLPGNNYNSNKKDMVHAPNHYSLNINGIKCQAKDVIAAVTGKIGDGYRAYCRGNELKYLIRADRKNGVEDLEKAKEYIDYEIARWKKLNEDT